MKTVITVVIVLAVIIFGYLWWRYSNCKKTEGETCLVTGGLIAGREASEIPVDLHLPPTKKTKCSFWKGKTCS